MDTKRLITAMVIAMAVMFAWQWFLKYMAVKNNWQHPGQETTATQPIAPLTTPTPLASAPTGAPPELRAARGLHIAAAATQPAAVELGSTRKKDSRYSLALALSGRGAGLSEVVLNEFNLAVREKQPYAFQRWYAGYENQSRALATRSVTINGQTIDLADANWLLEDQHSAKSASFYIDLADESGPVARIHKTFQVFPKDAQRLGYEVKVEQSVQNLGSKPFNVQTTINGVLPPPQELVSDDRQIIAGYLKNSTMQVGHFAYTDLTAQNPSKDLLFDKEKQPMSWLGASSIYFDAIVRPAAVPGSADVLALNPQVEDARERLVVTMLGTTETKLEPGAKSVFPMEVFFGPKQRNILNSPYYVELPRGYNSTLSTNVGGCGTICAWGWLIDALVQMLRGFHYITRDWGLAIICLVIIVRLVLHPITKRSTISMQKMSKMGPEMERLKKKYGDNKDDLNKAMMQLYKEQGMGPFLGCLPMFLQMPIWIALYTALQNTFELRHAPFLHPGGFPLTWIYDLAKPDGDPLMKFSQPLVIPWLGWHIYSINILPLTLALVFYLQQKFQPKPAAQTPEQMQQQKMMLWMSVLLFPLMLYSGPSGLNLYILTSTTIGIIESKRIRDHIKQQDEAEKAGRVFVETRPTGGQKRLKDDSSVAQPKTGITGWLAKLQAKAEELQRQAKRQGKGR